MVEGRRTMLGIIEWIKLAELPSQLVMRVVAFLGLPSDVFDNCYSAIRYQALS